MKTCLVERIRKGKENQETRNEPASVENAGERIEEGIPKVIDHKVTLLAAAGGAMAAGCDLCVDRIVPGLEEAGVTEADVRWAMENGQFSGAHAELSSFALGQVLESAREDACDHEEA
jgi:hypothetical protein